MDPLLAALRNLRRRLLLTRWTRYLVSALIYASCFALAWLVATRLFPSLGAPEPIALALGAAAIILASAWAVWRRPTLLQTAVEADRRLDLDERLTSSLELADSTAPMVAELHADARTQLARLDVRKEFPFAPPRSLRWLCIPLALFLTCYVLLPEFDLLNFRERQAEAKAREEAVRVEAKRLLDAAKPLLDVAKEVPGSLEGVAEGVERIAEGLEIGEITEKQAVARLANLSKMLEAEQAKLAAKTPIPKLGAEMSKLSMAKDVANNFQSGDFDSAADKLREMARKLEAGELSPEAQEQLRKELNELAKALGEDSMLGEALKDIAAGLSMNDIDALKAALEKLELSAEDLKSLKAQMAQLQKCQNAFGECQNRLFCSECQGICKGNCKARLFAIGRGGLRGPGRGVGNQIGELPEVETSLDPKLLPGDMTKGRVLASIVQRAAPTGEDDASVDYSQQALVQVKQQAEEALTREEIPAGSREFVRQYFGSLEPEAKAGEEPAPSAGQ